jgi:V/A-type H+-transporting ATPase subunit I
VGLRPRAARWFELLTPTDALAATVEALARTGHVQVETQRLAPAADAFRELGPELERYETLARRHRPHFPNDDLRPSASGAPAVLLAAALERLVAWARAADPVIRRLEALEAERRELLLLRELVEAGGAALPSFDDLRRAGPRLSTRIAVLAARAPALDLPGQVLRHRIDGGVHTFLLLVGGPADTEHAYRALAALEPSSIGLPPEAGIEPELVRVEREIGIQQAELEALHQRFEIRRGIADVRRLRWFAANAPSFPRTENFSIVTGWCDDWSSDALCAALRREGLPALVHFPASPEGLEPPIVLSNPPWARPFERVTALLGVPSRYETDPSMVLAFVAPLLFGYMFGDVGHGVVLSAVGLALRKRFPALAMLVPAGLVASAFGWVFGSVFTAEEVIRPLWLHPLERPLAVLGGSLAIGAVVLVFGIVLSAFGSIWVGHAPVHEIGLVLVFLGVGGALVQPAYALVAALGLLFVSLADAILAERRRVRAALRGLADLFERALQLLVNTLSFARIGAFALAHAGLSTAVVTLVETSEDRLARLLLLVVGNAFILVLEGLVVSIQTARLVLFEFFARFFRGEGRVFHPLVPPAESSA